MADNIQQSELGRNTTVGLLRSVDLKEDGEDNILLQDVLVVRSGSVEVVVVSDSHNKCIKSFIANDSDTLQISRLEYDVGTYRLTKLTPSSAVVTLSLNQIAFFNILPVLSKDRIIETQRQYSDFTLIDDSTLAGIVGFCGHHPYIDVLNMHGDVLRSIGITFELKSPTFMAMTGDGDLLVSDVLTCTLTRVSQKGEVRFCYSRRDASMFGVRWRKGSIFLADGRNETILQLSETGEVVRNFLSKENDPNFCKPVSFYFCEKNSTIFVCSDRRYVLIYEFE